MSAEVIPLALRRPIKPARDCYRVEASPGTVNLTVIDGNGHDVTLILTREDRARLRNDLDDAADIAEALARG
jgi:hypothetical protein